jgi:hypothetical protein
MIQNQWSVRISAIVDARFGLIADAGFSVIVGDHGRARATSVS